LLATPRPPILCPNSIEQECALFIYNLVDDIVDAVINRLAGWWGGSISSVRNSLTATPMKCHPDSEIGQSAGLSSTEFGLASMILAGVSVGTVRDLCYIDFIRLMDYLLK
jgi:hypothetical protein